MVSYRYGRITPPPPNNLTDEVSSDSSNYDLHSDDLSTICFYVDALGGRQIHGIQDT